MPYSVGGSTLSPVEDKSASYLSALSDATQNMNNSLKDLAKLPGDYLNYMQDDADARYVAALNKYSNDPTGLANALQNGEIDTSNVRAETLGKTQDTLSNIHQNYNVGYLQNRVQNYNDFLDNPANMAVIDAGQQAAYHGDIKGVNSALEQLQKMGAPSELFREYTSKWNAQPELDKQEDLAISKSGVGAQWATHNLAAQKYNNGLKSLWAMHAYSQLQQKLGTDKHPALLAKLNDAVSRGIPIKLKGGSTLSTDGIAQGLSLTEEGSKFWDERGGYNLYKASATSGSDTGMSPTPLTGNPEKDSDIDALLNMHKKIKK